MTHSQQKIFCKLNEKKRCIKTNIQSENDDINCSYNGKRCVKTKKILQKPIQQKPIQQKQILSELQQLKKQLAILEKKTNLNLQQIRREKHLKYHILKQSHH
jgi:hypothetical protein